MGGKSLNSWKHCNKQHKSLMHIMRQKSFIIIIIQYNLIFILLAFQMATFQYFPSPSLPFVHPFAPLPPPHVVPPPPPHVLPPPPPSHPIAPPPRAHPPPPPSHPIAPPPRVHPPPPPFHPIVPPPHVLPPPSPDNAPTVVIVVFVSFGCFLFAAFCCFALWCLIKKRKRKMVKETDIIRTDEHLRVKEAIVQGPNGPEVVVLSIEDDKHTQEDIIKNETYKQLHGKAKSGETAATDHLLETGKSSSNLNNPQTHNLL